MCELSVEVLVALKLIVTPTGSSCVVGPSYQDSVESPTSSNSSSNVSVNSGGIV